MWPFRRKEAVETRSSGSGYTAQVMAARQSYFSGAAGIGELTATVQSCVTLWENGMSYADVTGTDLLDRHSLALAGRALALRGECVFLITETGLIPAYDWDLKTRNGKPTAYRLTIPDVGGGRAETALAAEVLHFRHGSDVSTPYIGTAPLRRASVTAELLQAIETAMAEVYRDAPLGSMIVPFPEAPKTDMETLARGFRGKRGGVLIRESVNVSAAGGPAPQQDWKPNDLTPDLSKAMTKASLDAARDAICGVFGVLPGLMNSATTGPMVREAQRHLGGWTLQPLAMKMAEECTAKLGSPVMIDVMRPTQAYDVGGRARALQTIVEAMARAKELQLTPAEVNTAMTLVNWGDGDKAA